MCGEGLGAEPSAGAPAVPSVGGPRPPDGRHSLQSRGGPSYLDVITAALVAGQGDGVLLRVFCWRVGSRILRVCSPLTALQLRCGHWADCVSFWAVGSANSSEPLLWARPVHRTAAWPWSPAGGRVLVGVRPLREAPGALHVRPWCCEATASFGGGCVEGHAREDPGPGWDMV